MSYRERQRLADIQAAIDAIRSHLQRGDLSDGLILDAVRIRLLAIGEAVKALPDTLLATQPSIPWRQITRMRDHLAHRYFDTAHAILQATVDEDLRRVARSMSMERECGKWWRNLLRIAKPCVSISPSRPRPSRLASRATRAPGRAAVDRLTEMPRCSRARGGRAKRRTRYP
jgi:uncharacterized protein with HEPN domain